MMPEQDEQPDGGVAEWEQTAEVPLPLPVAAGPVAPASVHEAQAAAIAGDGARADAEGRVYPSLYDTTGGTLLAITMAAAIIGGVLWSVARIYQRSRDEHAALTQFVTTMVALVVGAYIADLLVAGPDTSLLTEGEHASILSFVKDTCLMVFSYYFGTRAVPPPQAAAPAEPPTPENLPGEA
jgi:hypothetical protein